MARSDRIAAILADEDFKSVVKETRDDLTRKVMAPTTSDEDRQKALTTYHALNLLLSRMAGVASDKETS